MSQAGERAKVFRLRLSPSLTEAALAISREQSTSLNHFIAIALSERLVRLQALRAPDPDAIRAKPS